MVRDVEGSKQPHQAIARGSAVASDNKTHAPWGHVPSCDLSAQGGAHAPVPQMQHFQLMQHLGAACMNESMQHEMPAGSTELQSHRDGTSVAVADGKAQDRADNSTSMLSAGSKHASLQLQQRSTRTTKDTGGMTNSQKATSSEITTPARTSDMAVPDAPERFADKPVNQEVVNSDDASAANAVHERPRTAGGTATGTARDRRLAVCLDYLAVKLPTSISISAQDELLSGAPRGRRDASCLDYAMPAAADVTVSQDAAERKVWAARNRRNTVGVAGSNVAGIEKQE